MFQNKKDLRDSLRLKGKTLLSDARYRSEASKKITNQILNLQEYKDADIVFAFMALNDEADLSAVIQETIADGKILGLPKILDKDGLMKFYKLSGSQKTIAGTWDIQEPDSDAEKIDDNLIKSSKTLVLVPGMAFTKGGKRLGRGKGFYDRELARLKDLGGTKITFAGVCLPHQLIEELPTDSNDVLMDFVLA